ncbi:ferrochelatase [Gephyromycinifex aptenodytis]|uniref:ferrochelatase n=1 Tax=Gephyromycinifex aptenodytis TaxID=2716227 RepID=UPI001445B1E6|nr:ferrochelatase [Gephyromycinifex aptenodytis]
MSDLHPYDALLLLSFGGPERPEEVMPFLQHVTGGKGVPQERLVEVAHHYDIRGGRSPINDENRALLAGLRAEFARRGVKIPLFWGNRHSAPFTTQALREAHQSGARRILTLVTSAYPSYSGCRQYREDLADSLAELAAEGIELQVDKLRPYADHPAFVAPTARLVRSAVTDLTQRVGSVHLAFVTHSIPVSMAQHSGPNGDDYLRLHRELAVSIVEELARTGTEVAWSLVFCSRSGPPHQPWLEPDIVDHLADLAEEGIEGVVCAPIGFVADHMEVVHDLDTEAAQTARELGLVFTRVPTVRDDSQFVAGLVDLCFERAAQARGEQVEPITVSPTGAALPAPCAPGCCPNPRVSRPAVCGSDDGASLNPPTQRKDEKS